MKCIQGLLKLDELARQKGSTLPEILGVNVADISDEGCWLYLGRSDRYIAKKDEFLK